MTDRNNDDVLPTKEELEKREEELREQLAEEPVVPSVRKSKNTNPFAEILNFPNEIVDLPSAPFAKKIYPTTPQLHTGQVEISQMYSTQENILTNRSLIEDGTVFDRLLDSVLVTDGVHASQLVEGDKNLILSRLRVNAYGANYPVKIPCKGCNSVYEDSMNLDEDLQVLGQDPPSMVRFVNGEIHAKLPESEIEVVLDFIKTNIESQSHSLQKSKKKLKKLGVNPEASTDVTFSERLKLLIKSGNGHANVDHLEYMVDHLPARDLKFLKVLYAKYIPNIKISKISKCPTCGLDSEREVGFSVDFFWPSD